MKIKEYVKTREEMNKILFHYRRSRVSFMEAMEIILKMIGQSEETFEATAEDVARILLSKKKDFFNL